MAGVSQGTIDAAIAEVTSFDIRLGKIDRKAKVLTWMVGGLYVVLTAALALTIWLVLLVAGSDAI